MLCEALLHTGSCSSNKLTWGPGRTWTDVEEISSKTGSFKSYKVFMKMLLTALKRESDNVVVDLLTYKDLDMLRSRQAGSAGPDKPATNDTVNSKRYLIMTYNSEFDRIHYPLPLQYVASPDPKYLKSIIARLRSEAKHFYQVSRRSFQYCCHILGRRSAHAKCSWLTEGLQAGKRARGGKG